MAERVRIERMLYGGNGGGKAVEDATGEEAGEAAHTGLGHGDARELRMPFVLPGELVEIASHGHARIVQPSSDRIAPQCVHFLSCGGCHYQHAAYSLQLDIKSAVLRDTLVEAGITGLPPIATHSSEPWRYRNRIRLRVSEVEGELRVGYSRREQTRGDTFLPIVMCAIAAPLLWRTAEAVVGLAKTELTVAVWLKSAVEIELFTTADESKLQLTLFIRQTINASFSAFCKLLQQAVPELSGAGIAILPPKPSPRGRRSERAKAGAQWGSSGMMYAVDQDNFWISRSSFFQVNRFLVSQLVAFTVAGRSGTLAWDLYAGVGLFSRALAQSFAQVVGVEAAEPAATDLAAALKGEHRAVAMTTLEFLRIAVVQRDRPDLIVLDPPRAGIGDEVCGLLARIAAPEVVYVSCDPITLARDLKDLTGSGYQLQRLHMIDLFPQTFHQETVAILVR